MLYRLPVALSTLLSLAAVVAATPASLERLYGIERRSAGRSCGSHLTPEAVSEKEEAFASRLAQKPAANRVAAAAVFTVPVFFHVITFNGEGDIP